MKVETTFKSSIIKNEELIGRLSFKKSKEFELKIFSNIDNILEKSIGLLIEKDNPISKWNSIGNGHVLSGVSKTRLPSKILIHDNLIKYITHEITEKWQETDKDNFSIKAIENKILAEKLNKTLKTKTVKSKLNKL